MSRPHRKANRMGKLLTMNDDEDFINGVVYGKSGTGKTTIGVSSPQPFILLSERQGYRSVRDAARNLGKEIPPVLFIENIADLRACIRALNAGGDEPIAVALREVLLNNKRDAKGELVEPTDADRQEVERQIAALPYLRPKTLVLDSVTDFFVLISDDILEGMGFPKSSTDGLEIKPERYWGLLKDRSERLLRTFRDSPYHIIFLCLLDEREVGNDEQKTRLVGPDTPMRKLPGTLVAASNFCGLAYVEQQVVKDSETEALNYEHTWRVRLAGPSWMTLKPIKPLREVEDPDLSEWFARIQAQDSAAQDEYHQTHPEPAQDSESDEPSEDQSAESADASDPASTNGAAGTEGSAEKQPGTGTTGGRRRRSRAQV